ncbi:Expansin-a9 [Thalictrum thalictroides]|uniref:Expansin n=1 Tax=Thalictrum thalictroides TaxID=46969 RepID=A0A7J6VE98_THATH|nr:Expansin-a9 [Thalictrum thalictroides]
MAFFSAVVTEGKNLAKIHPWMLAHATFYGDMSGQETMQGACGYGNLYRQGYGLETTALSTALFNNGLTCGACYELKCFNSSQWCIPGTIRVTATNFCPPNWDIPSDNGGWCNPPRKHFDLSMPMFVQIAHYKAGIIPVLYRRVPCFKQGGIKFEIKGNPYWTLVLVYNVADVGNIIDVKIKGSNTGWIKMTRNWGQNWQTFTRLQGQSLSFQVISQTGRMVQSDNVAPPYWQFGQTFEGRQFR